LTFEKAIIDAQAAFAHGQVYVALSRCKSFEGIVLRSPISYKSVKTDGLVKDYSEEAANNPPNEAHLEAAKKEYQQALITELLSFRGVRSALNDLLKIAMEYQFKFNAPVFPKVMDWETQADRLLFAPSAKFAPALQTYFAEPTLPIANKALQERLHKASQYFANKIKIDLYPDLQNIAILTDNQAIKIKISAALSLLQKEVFIKQKCYQSITKNGFDITHYLKTKASAAIDFERIKLANKPTGELTIPDGVPHPILYKELYHWRNAQAATLKRQAHEIIPTNSMIGITKKLPTTKAMLLSIKGVGAQKFKVFGKAILDMVDDYCYKHQLAANITTTPADTSTPPTEAPKAYSVAAIRKTHPKAYASWTPAEEKELQQLKEADNSICYIADVMGRKRGAITSRLKRLEEGVSLVGSASS